MWHRGVQSTPKRNDGQSWHWRGGAKLSVPPGISLQPALQQGIDLAELQPALLAADVAAWPFAFCCT